MPYYVPFSAYAKMVAAGIIAYAVIASMQMRRVKKVPMDIALNKSIDLSECHFAEEIENLIERI